MPLLQSQVGQDSRILFARSQNLMTRRAVIRDRLAIGPRVVAIMAAEAAGESLCPRLLGCVPQVTCMSGEMLGRAVVQQPPRGYGSFAPQRSGAYRGCGQERLIDGVQLVVRISLVIVEELVVAEDGARCDF
jgi:hypothetical protein